MSRAAECLATAGSLHERSASVSLSTPASNKAKEGTLRQTINLWFDRSRQRRELRELIDSPEETFKDIGISRYDVQREERKPFWRR